MPNNNAIWFLLGVIITVIVLVGGYFFYSQMQNGPMAVPPTGPRACTMEAKQCPDGSYVGRQGPNCEFAACPSGADVKIY